MKMRSRQVAVFPLSSHSPSRDGLLTRSLSVPPQELPGVESTTALYLLQGAPMFASGMCVGSPAPPALPRPKALVFALHLPRPRHRSSLFFSPLSDKIGRKPLILMCLYVSVGGTILKWLMRDSFWGGSQQRVLAVRARPATHSLVEPCLPAPGLPPSLPPLPPPRLHRSVGVEWHLWSYTGWLSYRSTLTNCAPISPNLCQPHSLRHTQPIGTAYVGDVYADDHKKAEETMGGLQALR